MSFINNTKRLNKFFKTFLKLMMYGLIGIAVTGCDACSTWPMCW